MFLTIASVFAAACYGLSALLIFKHIGHPVQIRWIPLLPALAAIVLHAISLAGLIYHPGGLNLGFFAAFSLVSWLISIQIIVCCIFRRIESLGIAIFPISAIAVIFSSIFISDRLIMTVDKPLQSHILISVIAYSLITLAAFQAVLLAYQDNSIRSHNPGGFIRFLPPIHDMETLLFQFLGFGFVFLSASLLSGFLFLEDIFAQHLVHKTVLSIVAWCLLGTLLFGRIKFGWRGKTAIRWTLTSFVFLMLAFFGSKLVLEFIIKPL